MKRGARDSQVVNNFFTFATIVIVSIVLSLYVKYFGQEKKQTFEVSKLQCEKESYTKVKFKNLILLKKSINALDKGYYKLNGGIIETQTVKSKIKDFITLNEIDAFYTNEIGVKPKKNIEKFLKIKYELIENDKNDKLNSASLITSFRINSKEIFRVFTNIDFIYKNAIKQRVECSIKVYKNYVLSAKKQ